MATWRIGSTDTSRIVTGCIDIVYASPYNIIGMHFEWDEAKDRGNIKSHGISFEDAKDVFDDPFHISILDKRFDYFDERWITIGCTKDRRIIVIGHLYYLRENGEEVIRIITARKAVKKERDQYESIGK